MGVETLILPRPKIEVPRLPSYIKLMMAFGLGTGTSLFDKSRHRAHGTISGAAWATGLHGYALDFVATNKDYVEIAAAYDHLDFTSEDFSVIMRMKFDVLSTRQRLLVRGGPITDGWWLFRGSDNTINVFTAQSGIQQSSTSSAAIASTAVWYTVGFSRDGASVTIFIDGAKDTPTAGIHYDPATCARSLKIGIKDDKVTEPFDGKIEFLAVFGVALAASEHSAWHNALA